jgi:hypothetical protein
VAEAVLIMSAGIRIGRRGPGRPRTRARALNPKAYSSRAIRSPLRRRRRTNAEFTAAGRVHHGDAGGPIGSCG